MQPAPQRTSPNGHEVRHDPLTHACPFTHANPAVPPSKPHPSVAPQCKASASGSTHTLPQRTLPGGHELEQTPSTHAIPLPQEIPLDPASSSPQPSVAPQCALSVAGFT